MVILAKPPSSDIVSGQLIGTGSGLGFVIGQLITQGLFSDLRKNYYFKDIKELNSFPEAKGFSIGLYVPEKRAIWK